jgi:hypothetical protein
MASGGVRWNPEDPVPEAPEGPNGEPVYASNIPAGAEERPVRWYPSGKVEAVECWFDGEVVGRRCYHETGELEGEWPERGGRSHGVDFCWYNPGRITSAEPRLNGFAHGRAKQWSDTGKLIGGYTMIHGTGWDLWWQDWPERPAELTEARAYRNGARHGFEWWLTDGRPREETHFSDGRKHGIERRWNAKGRLARGYPKYWIHDEQVTKRRYLRAAAKDPTLPPFDPRDNLPDREFPSPVREALARVRTS